MVNMDNEETELPNGHKNNRNTEETEIGGVGSL